MPQPKYPKYIFLIIACILAFFSSMAFSAIFHARIADDSKEYDDLGWNLASNRGFVAETPGGELKPTMSREPGYPLFLSIIYRLFGHNYRAVYIFQAILFSGITALSFFLALDIFGLKAANISSLLIAIFPTLGDYTIYLLSEIFFSFLLIALIFILSRSLERESAAYPAVIGILLGAITLTKAIMVFFILFIITGFILVEIGKKSAGKIIIKIISISLIFLAIVIPWILRNHDLFGTYSVTLRGGKALYNRSIKLDYGYDRWKKILAFSISEFLGQRLYPNIVAEGRDFLLLEDQAAEKRIGEMTAKGMSPEEADKVLREEALDKIHKRPFRYIGQSFLESVKLIGFTHIPSLHEEVVINSFLKIRNGRAILAIMRGLFRLAAFPIIFLSIIGVCATIGIWKRWVFVFLAVAYLTMAYSLTFSWARYAVPLIPFYIIFASAGFLQIIKKP